MATITINGQTFTGDNMIISNGRIVVNGNDLTPNGKEINIAINGNIDRLEVDACQKVGVIGDVGNIKTQSGDVDVKGNVKGNIQTMSGDVDCQQVFGSVSTMSGDISHGKGI
jgi:hypothetical protein